MSPPAPGPPEVGAQGAQPVGDQRVRLLPPLPLLLILLLPVLVPRRPRLHRDLRVRLVVEVLLLLVVGVDTLGGDDLLEVVRRDRLRAAAGRQRQADAQLAPPAARQ